ncbi:MAG: hypothetical protein JXR03_19655 [Cyclobacteriaceae bacterium]
MVIPSQKILSHFEVEGDADIAYIRFYYDFEDKTYEGLDILEDSSFM